MMAMRGAVLLLALASTFLALAEAKPLTGAMFGKTENYFLTHSEAVDAFHAMYAKPSTKASTKAKAGSTQTITPKTAKPQCEFIFELDPAGLTVCQKGVCKCPQNEHCVTYSATELNGMGICACGNHLCDYNSGLDCAVTVKPNGKTKHTCVNPMAPPPPYVGSRLMRKALR